MAKNGPSKLEPVLMATWAQTIRHPWFNPPTMKRRLAVNDEETSPPSQCAPTCRKRVKYSSLEHTLANMTLDSAKDVDMWPRTSSPRPCMQPIQVVVPSSVEEPDMLTSDSDDMDVEPTGKPLTHLRILFLMM